MQWTVEQMIAELAHIDTQLLSYCERAAMQKLGNESKVKTIRKWLKAHTEMACLVLGELHQLHPALHDEIVNEQSDSPRGYQSPHIPPTRIPRDSLN